MREVLFLVLHLLTTIARLLGPGGGRAIVAENLLLKHQLLVYSRSRKRAPHLSMRDRVLFGSGMLVTFPESAAYKQSRHYREALNFAEITRCTNAKEIPTPLLCPKAR